MNTRRITALFLVSALGAGAHAADELQEHVVQVEHRLNASADRAWRTLGRFCALAAWQSVVAGCDVVERDNGIVRTVVMQDHTVFVERLEEFSDATRRFSYSMISGPVAVQDYHATFWIRSSADPAASTLSLQARFRAPRVAGAAIAGQLKQLFDNGLRGIDAVLATAGVGSAGTSDRAASALGFPSLPKE
jgi:hypothetical protein